MLFLQKFISAGQKYHSSWLSKPVGFRTQSSLPFTPAPVFNSPARSHELARLPAALGMEAGGGLDWNPGPQPQPRAPSLPVCPNPGREEKVRKNLLGPTWPFPESISSPRPSLKGKLVFSSPEILWVPLCLAGDLGQVSAPL